MSERNEWREFFDVYAPDYMKEPFTRGTVEEIDFLVDTLGLTPGATVLDLGCGAGRHSVELARRGFKVTGVDISDGQLRQARQAADDADVSIELVRADATAFIPDRKWDSAMCVCEGGFGLLGSGDDPLEHDLQILRTVRSALNPGGKFFLTCLSVLMWARVHTPEEVESGSVDTATLSEIEVMDAGAGDAKQTFNIRQRVFSPTEIALMLKVAGFEVDHIGGGTAARWTIRPLELDEYEIMAIAHAV